MTICDDARRRHKLYSIKPPHTRIRRAYCRHIRGAIRKQRRKALVIDQRLHGIYARIGADCICVGRHHAEVIGSRREQKENVDESDEGAAADADEGV
jgi:hypothetical protein